MKGTCSKACLVVALAITCVAGASGQSIVTITDLGTLPGDNFSFPVAVNEAGQVIGVSQTDRLNLRSRHAFSWTAADGMVHLTLGGSESFPKAINKAGQVVGFSDTASSRFHHAFSWTAAAGIVDLTFPGGDVGEARDVNESGQVVGVSETAGGEQRHAFSWTAAGGMVDLGILPGGFFSFADAVNDAGQVVGASIVDEGPFHAFSWTAAGGMVDLGTLGGTESRALFVTEAGQVVGWSGIVGSGSRHAFSWTAAGGMVDLTPGAISSEFEAVSEAGQVVGSMRLPTAPSRDRAFSWTAAGGLVDLGTLGGLESEALAVNEAGQVVGGAEAPFVDEEGQEDVTDRAFLWTAADGMADLGTIGGVFSRATAVNEAGQVVGLSSTAESETSSGETHAFLWTAAGGMVDLGTLGDHTFSEAIAVNEAGQVVGGSREGGSSHHAVLWTIGSPGTVTLDVTIDIKPGSFPNSINPGGHGVIPVAILTTSTLAGEPADFDAASVAPSSVEFGPSGATATSTASRLEDVDGDGDLDLVLHFRTAATGIACGDDMAAVTGETFEGQPIAGSDSVRTVGCK